MPSADKPEARLNGISVIGLIVPDITNPFFAQLAKSVEMEAGSRGLMVMLANSHEDPDIERTQVRALQQRSVAGIIVAATSDSTVPHEAEVPIVSIDRRYAHFPLIATDQRDGSRKLADHLHKLGHRRIAYIAGPESMEVARQRRDGFTRRIANLSVPDDPIEITVEEGAFHFEAGEEIARNLLSADNADARPTAIAAASDLQAIGVLRGAQDLGIRVPHELSVVGFDDITLASIVVPRLTTFRQPMEEMASGALDRILFTDAPPTDYAIRGSLVVRESTARPKR